MRQRVYALVITVLSLVAIVLAAGTWVDGRPSGFLYSATGLGTSHYSFYDDGDAAGVAGIVRYFSANPLGIGVVAACMVILVIAIAMATPWPHSSSAPLCWTVAALSLLAAAVPLAVLIEPKLFLGDALSEFGMGEIGAMDQHADLRREMLQQGTLIELATVLLLLTAVSAIAATTTFRKHSPAAE